LTLSPTLKAVTSFFTCSWLIFSMILLMTLS